MKILIIGATGAMGTAIAENMSLKGHTVYALSRRKYNAKNENIIPIVGNAFDTDFVKSIVEQKFDCIIDFYGILRILLAKVLIAFAKIAANIFL